MDIQVRILLIGIEEKGIGRCLADTGYVILEATVANGLQQAKRENPHIIIVCEKMDLVESLAELNTHPYIIVMGLGDDMDLVASIAAGADLHLSSAVDKKELLARVQAFLRRSLRIPLE